MCHNVIYHDVQAFDTDDSLQEFEQVRNLHCHQKLFLSALQEKYIGSIYLFKTNMNLNVLSN